MARPTHDDAVQTMYRFLKLEDPDEFALSAIGKNLKNYAVPPKERLRLVGRHRGRTTRMCVIALIRMQQGNRVIVAAHSNHYAEQLVRRIRAWAADLGIDPTLVLQDDGMGGFVPAAIYLHDHCSIGPSPRDGFDD